MENDAVNGSNQVFEHHVAASIAITKDARTLL